MGDQSAHYIILYYLPVPRLTWKKIKRYTYAVPPPPRPSPPSIRGRDGPPIGPYNVQFYSRRRSRLV